MSLVHNEQTKLSASWLNTLATALVATGTFAPVVALPYGVSLGRTVLVVAAVACCAGGAILHFGGRALLRGLQE